MYPSAGLKDKLVQDIINCPIIMKKLITLIKIMMKAIKVSVIMMVTMTTMILYIKSWVDCLWCKFGKVFKGNLQLAVAS